MSKRSNDVWYIIRNAAACVVFAYTVLWGVNYLLNDLRSKSAEPAPVQKVESISLSPELRRDAVERCMKDPVLKTGTNPALSINADLNIFSNQIAKKLEEIKQKQ